MRDRKFLPELNGLRKGPPLKSYDRLISRLGMPSYSWIGWPGNGRPISSGIGLMSAAKSGRFCGTTRRPPEGASEGDWK